MSKYIKLEGAIHNINLEVTGRKEYTGDMKANLFFALDDLPTIDIVTCEDCKHGEYREDFDNYLCDQLGLGSVNDAEFFCSYGERIEE